MPSIVKHIVKKYIKRYFYTNIKRSKNFHPLTSTLLKVSYLFTQNLIFNKIFL